MKKFVIMAMVPLVFLCGCGMDIDNKIYSTARELTSDLLAQKDVLNSGEKAVVLNVNNNSYNGKIPLNLTVTDLGNPEKQITIDPRWVDVIENGIISKLHESGINSVEKIEAFKECSDGTNRIDSEKLLKTCQLFSVDKVITYEVTGLGFPGSFLMIFPKPCKIRVFIKAFDATSCVVKWAGIIEKQLK